LKILPSLLGRTRCEVVSLNAHYDEDKVTRTTKQFDRAVRQLSQYVEGLGAGVGAIISASGETLFLLDEKGRWVDGGNMLQVLARLTFETNPGCTVAAPASASGNLEKLAAQYGGRVLRTPINPSAILDTAATSGAYMAGNGEGGVAFPEFHPSFDAMFCLVKTVEMLARTGYVFGDLVDSLPEAYLQHSIVPCPWEAKGLVMRKLVEELGEDAKGIEGVRFDEGDGWILIFPSSNHACFHIYAESSTPDGVGDKLRTWSKKVEKMQE
jgi:mannose-1-phosphate guanylyltransferase/phosphomannomutase